MTTPVGVRRLIAGRHSRRRVLLVGQRREPLPFAQAIHVALREDRAEPGAEAAASLEVAEERAPLCPAFGHAVEIRVQGVGEVARAAAGVEGIGRAVEDWPVFKDEPFPGLLLAGSALTRELEVAGVRGAHRARTGSASSSSSWNGRPWVISADCSMRGTRSIGSSCRMSSPPLAACSSLNLRAFTSTLPSSDPTASLYASRLDLSFTPSVWKCPPSDRTDSYRFFPRSLILRAFSSIASCCQPYATARSSAISVVGLAGMTRFSTPHSMSDGSFSSAALKNISPGRNMTTNSGVEATFSK